jgi:hypothetical protein
VELSGEQGVNELEFMTDLVAELKGLDSSSFREITLTTTLPDEVFDNHAAKRAESVADLASDSDVAQRSTAMMIVCELLRCIVSGRVPVLDIDSFWNWVRRVRPLAVRHIVESDEEHALRGVLALYLIDLAEDREWLDADSWVPRIRAEDPDLHRRLEDLLSSPSSAINLATSIEIARIDDGVGLSDRVLKMFQTFLAYPSNPADDFTAELGDARSLIRRITDERAEQFSLFAMGCESEHPLARYQNVGQCVRLLETWRDAPANLLPVLADHVTDSSAPVRLAAVGAVYRSDRSGFDYLDRVITLLDDPLAGVEGAAPPRLVDMLRGEAIGALVAAGREEVVADLKEYLESPFGSVPLADIVADASCFAEAIEPNIRYWLLAAQDRAVEPYTLRHLSSVLSGLLNWKSAAIPLLNDLISLMSLGVAETAVVEVLAAMGPYAPQVEDILVSQLDPANEPARRATAASGIIESGMRNIETAATTLVEMLKDQETERLAIGHLSVISWPDELLGMRRDISARMLPRLAAANPIDQPALAKILWECGERRPDYARVFANAVSPCPSGLRCIDWLVETGASAIPYRAGCWRSRVRDTGHAV